MAANTGTKGRVDTLGRRMLGKRLDEERSREDGRTQRVIAGLIGTTEKSLWTWRSGTRRPSELLKARIFQVLGIDPGSWLTAEERRKLQRRVAA